jgi:hypothetical protein
MALQTESFTRGVRTVALLAGAWIATLPVASAALADPGTVNVTVKSSGTEIKTGFRWLLEEDSTWFVDPRQPDADTTTATLALNMHKSSMTVVAQGHADSSTAAIPVPDNSKRYFLSILPDQGESRDATTGQPVGASNDCAGAGPCYTQGGRQVTPELFGWDPRSPATVPASTADLTITVPSQPVPTAQIYARAFQDSAPINGVWDNGEQPLGGWTVFIYDMGGQMMADTFGNPLGTLYDANNQVIRMGDGTLHTMTAEEAADPERNPYGIAEGDVLVKGIAPGKYGIQIVPPAGQEWQQVSTIEGTRGLDVWVKANEPRYFAEFGAAGHHAEFGFVTTNADLNDFPKTQADADWHLGGTNSISGRIVNMRGARPPEVDFTGGHPLPGCWVGVNNDPATRGLAIAECDGDSKFNISGLQNGTYQLVVWDKYLDNVIAFQTVAVNGGNVDLHDVPVFRWFGSHHHWVFNDKDEDGVWDADEKGIPDQVINLRYRDGSIYNSSTTDTAGFLPYDEVFPFFSWLVAEVDFARFKATGVTVVSDAGGRIPAEGTAAYDAGGVLPPDSQGVLNPHVQAACEQLGASAPDVDGNCTGGNPYARVELAGDGAPPLTEGYNSFLGTTEVFLWGKRAYKDNENGGITGVVYYQTTRAENDPRFAAPETWEPGIPRVQVALYHADASGRLYHKNADGSRGTLASSSSPILLADVDNYPFDSAARPFPQIEDIDRGVDGTFDLGDAIEVTHTDSYDDSLPEDCRPHQNADGTPWTPPDNFYQGGKCFDGLRNYSQVRSTVFDGGYAFGHPFTDTQLQPGYYVVQANTPRGVDGSDVYQIQQEEDKNVDFGDAMTISPQALPPYCVGGMATDGTVLDQGVAPHEAGTHLNLFSTPEGPIDIADGFQGTRPGCDFRLVQVTNGKNAAADFFMFTEVPITGHIQGFVLNDVANEFNPLSPNFGEKIAPSWIPVSVRDYEGNEVYHTYTDKWGTYNAIVPSAFRINTPMPSGVSPNMLQVCLNAPTMQDAAGDWVPEPGHNRQYTQFCYTLDFKPGQTTYLDTPVLPVAAFVGPSNWQLDCEYPSGTPVIDYATVGSAGPYIASGATGADRVLNVFSMGDTDVVDPLAARVDSTFAGDTNAAKVTRDFGFGDTAGQVWIGSTLIDCTTESGCWTAERLAIAVPDVPTGQLRIRRSNGMETVHGLTVTVGLPGERDPIPVHTGGSIQAAIDGAQPGDLVMVEPGVYLEMLVMTKPIRLQGWGASSTIVNPVQSPTQKIADWRVKLNALANCTHEIGLLPGQPNNAAGTGPLAACGFVAGTGLFTNEEGAGILVAPVEGAFSAALAVGLAARIDGLTFSGSDQAAGIMVNAYATGLEISNNITVNNQGSFAAGIRVGQPMLTTIICPGDPDTCTETEVPVDAQNDGLNIHHNHVAENGGLFEAGAGIGLYTGTDGYLVNRNYVCGNYAGGNGAGIAHFGFSDNGRIVDNKVLFNQAFDQTVQNSGNGGGILVAGYVPAAGGGTPGTGSVSIERNLIQGNNAGSGEGGGIAIQQVNASNSGSKLVHVINNIVVNNVAGYRGGGISMDNASRVEIINNTIVNNDTSGTAASAFSNTNTPACTGSATTRSCPQPAGVVSSGGNISSGTSNGGGFRNNIVLGNRAFHVELTTDPVTGGSVINTIADGYADLGGSSLFNGTGDGIRNSLLGNTNISVSASTWTGLCTSSTRSNNCPEPTPALYASHFVNGSWNRAPFWQGAVRAEYQPAEAATAAGLNAGAVIAVAADEGGNFIDIHYGPLSQVLCYAGTTGCTGTGIDSHGEVLVDYHLKSSAELAIDAVGDGCAAAPDIDVDSQLRPKNCGGGTTGTPIAVANFSFEVDNVSNGNENSSGGGAQYPSGWSKSSNSQAGVGDPSGGGTPSGMTGSQYAYSYGGAVLSQTLGENLVANTTYTLSVDVGDRSNASFAGYSVQLYAGSTLVATATYSGSDPNNGFKTATGNVAIGAAHAALGQALQIRLASTSSSDSARTLFDNVRLSRVSAGGPVANDRPDRGGDEYWAQSTNGGEYVAGSTVSDHLQNLPPSLAAIGNQSAVMTVPFFYQTFAVDPNGDPLTYRLTTAPGGGTATVPLAVANAGFEAPNNGGGTNTTLPDSWSNAGTAGLAGTSRSFDDGNGPSNQQSAWTQYGGVLRQTLTGQTLQAGGAYQLQVRVGRQGNTSGFAGYDIRLLAGSTVLVSMSNTSGTNNGSFSTITLPTYTAPASGAVIGQTLSIELRSNRTGSGSGVYTYFDNVTLSMLAALPPMSISATGGINWTPAPNSSGCSGTGTRTCAVTVQVSDNNFAGGCTIGVNCASQSFNVSVTNYNSVGSGATGGLSVTGGGTTLPVYQVNTVGPFTVPAPGILGLISNANPSLRLTLTLLSPADGNIPGVGTVTLAADGSFTFTPNADWVGTSEFVVRVFDGLNAIDVTVPLERLIAVTTARYIKGTWTFEGKAVPDASNPTRIQIVRDGGGGGNNIATGSSRPTIPADTALAPAPWTFSLTGGPSFSMGTTVTISSCVGGNAGACNGTNTTFTLAAVPVLAGAANDVFSTAVVQCPIDANHDGVVQEGERQAGIVCKHLAAGDGWSVMADGTELYTFGFNDVSQTPVKQAIAKGILNAQFPGPTLDFDEDDEVYLTLTNVGMLLRPDLFDPHSVHFHGFPNAAAVFDGVPEASITINMGFSLTYYYKTLDPGTYMYHCHVEAAEHMQMGMLGNLYVRPKQNRLPGGTDLHGFTHEDGNKYVYNDGDGSTFYDVEYPIQIGSFDSNFHTQHIGVQPLPFAEMHDDYPMLNGRGYPDTMDPGVLPAAPSKDEADVVSHGETSQPMNTIITVQKGKRALLRISNLNVTRFYTLATNGLPMQVVGTGAHILRGPDGADLYYTTNSVTLGGGEAVDVLIDTSRVPAGTYLLYSTNLEALSNGAEDFGGMMTEITVVE